jgi:hypothetical protein
MNTLAHKTALFGDLIAATFDEAARYTSDTREMSRLAEEAVKHLVHRVRGGPVWRHGGLVRPLFVFSA